MNRAIIVSVQSELIFTIEQAARIEGFSSVAVISGGSEARRLIKGEPEPDLIIINAPHAGRIRTGAR